MTALPRSTLTTLWLGCTCLLWIACARGKPPTVAPLPRPDIVDTLPEGATLALSRPTPGVAKVALWMRAGSRHADPPALATVAAFWVEVSTGATARVLPDATELSLACDTRSEGIERCIGRLTRAFSARAPSADEAGRLRDRLRAARQRSRADGNRQLDLAALHALFGEQSRSLDPLGDERDDSRITPQAIATFLAAHYASDRSVLIAAGDVEPRSVASSFARTRRAASVSASSPPALTARTDVVFSAAPSMHVAAALATPSVALASTLAAQLRALYPKAVIRVIPLLSQPVLEVRIAGGEQPLKRVERLVFDLRRAALESSSSSKSLRPDESLDGLVRELGESWAARSGATRTLPTPWPLGIALGALPPRAPEANDSAKLQAEQAAAAKKAVERGEQLARGEVEGVVDQHHAEVQVSNGARITVQRRPGDRWVAATIRLTPGSAHDPVTRHGRAALLATLLADGCGQPWGSGLGEHLASLDARLEPLVEPSSIALSITAPVERASAALDVLLRCALTPELSQRAVENARVRLLMHLERTPGLRFSAHVAQMLAPQTPGAVAPWGTPFGVAEAPLSEIRRLHGESTRGVRVHVWIAADGEPERLAKFVARRLARLEKGEPSPAPADVGTVQPFGGELADVESLRVVIGLRADATGKALLAPQVFAAALRSALGARLGRPLWSEGEIQAQSVTAGIALALEEAELPALEAALRSALDELRARKTDEWHKLLRAAHYRQASALSSSLGWTQAASRGRLATGEHLDQEQAALSSLCKAEPTYWVLRPRP